MSALLLVTFSMRPMPNSSAGARRSSVRFGPMSWAVLLLLALSASHFATGGLQGARNYVVVLGVLLVFVVAQPTFAMVERASVAGFRSAALVSAPLFFVFNEWYVNKPDDFIDSGKIFASFPNAQGILGHPNYTGLFFAAGATLEVCRILRGQPGGKATRFVPVCFLASEIALLSLTQARNALLAFVVGSAAIVSVHFGRAFYARVLAYAAMAVATLPFVFTGTAIILGSVPNYSYLSALGTRSSLWRGTARVIDSNFWLGSGANFIRDSRRFVLDNDVLNVTHAHNQLLNLWGEGGFLALVLFAFYVFAVFSLLRGRGERVLRLSGLSVVFSFSCLSETPVTSYLTQAGTLIFLLMTIITALPAADGVRVARKAHPAVY